MLSEWAPRDTGVKRDYLYQAERNAALGEAGERAVVLHEQRRLIASGKSKLATRVEHVSTTKGDGLGYDILSFESSGQEKLIEVKTTLYAKETPFFVSRNELAASRHFGPSFHLYRLFQFRKKPGMYLLQGALDESCNMAQNDFVAVPK